MSKTYDIECRNFESGSVLLQKKGVKESTVKLMLTANLMLEEGRAEAILDKLRRQDEIVVVRGEDVFKPLEMTLRNTASVENPDWNYDVSIRNRSSNETFFVRTGIDGAYLQRIIEGQMGYMPVEAEDFVQMVECGEHLIFRGRENHNLEMTIDLANGEDAARRGEPIEVSYGFAITYAINGAPFFARDGMDEQIFRDSIVGVTEMTELQLEAVAYILSFSGNLTLSYVNSGGVKMNLFVFTNKNVLR